ncbi:zinc metalloprotease HtpX [Leptotrichia alba]|uniref:Protease HtpX homolog n=1 Tax=Leptotrichia alba TaxID=3239304 RepID=A0AB39V6S3_9FUSO
MFMNTLKTGFLMLMLIVLFVIAGQALGGPRGALLGLLLAGGMSFYSYWFSDKMVINAYHGREVTLQNNPELYKMVQRLANNAQLPMPKVYVIPERQPNAFATGRNPENAAVACTAGLLELMDSNELSGVIAHELGHIKHRDILISTIAATFAGAISYIITILPYFQNNSRNNRRNNPAGTILIALLAPMAASIIQMSISRKREYMADRAGAEFSGNPLYLRNALKKLEYYSHNISMSKENPATAHMFIVNPLSHFDKLKNLFSTHPSTQDRIQKLEKMAKERHLL